MNRKCYNKVREWWFTIHEFGSDSGVQNSWIRNFFWRSFDPMVRHCSNLIWNLFSMCLTLISNLKALGKTERKLFKFYSILYISNKPIHTGLSVCCLFNYPSNAPPVQATRYTIQEPLVGVDTNSSDDVSLFLEKVYLKKKENQWMALIFGDEQLVALIWKESYWRPRWAHVGFAFSWRISLWQFMSAMPFFDYSRVYWCSFRTFSHKKNYNWFSELSLAQTRRFLALDCGRRLFSGYCSLMASLQIPLLESC